MVPSRQCPYRVPGQGTLSTAWRECQLAGPEMCSGVTMSSGIQAPYYPEDGGCVTRSGFNLFSRVPTLASSVIEVQAEDMVSIYGYEQEERPGSPGSVSVMRVQRVPREGVNIGVLSYNFPGQPGKYNLFVNAYDENDGIGSIEVRIGSKVVLTEVLDQDYGKDNPQDATRVQIVVPFVDLNTNDLISFIGKRDAGDRIGTLSIGNRMVMT